MTGDRRDKAPAHGYYTDMLCFVERALMYLIFSRQSSYIILFRSVPLCIVTHTGIYKERNGISMSIHCCQLLIGHFSNLIFFTKS